jgi:ACS family hexuronate transporter-like MFS transporter
MFWSSRPGDFGMQRPSTHASRWLMLAFAFLATVINYLDRQTLSVLAPVLLERFKISATTYSHIIFAFMLAYTVMNGVSGPLLDRLGTKIGYALTISWWSAAEILQAFSGGALGLGIFRFLLGRKLSCRGQAHRGMVSG